MKAQALKIAAAAMELDPMDYYEMIPAAFRSVMGRAIRWDDPADMDLCNLASRILETVNAFY